MSNIVITGAGRPDSLGYMIAELLSSDGHRVAAVGLEANTDFSVRYGRAECFQCDVTVDRQVVELVRDVKVFFGGRTEVVINCAGINLIGMLEEFQPSDWDRVLDVNAKAIYLTSRYFLDDLIDSKGTILNIVSNASHMPMTGSLAYNASKGAAHIMTLQLARELTRRHGITVFGISPNKLRGTGMSTDIATRVCETRGWTPEEAERYQLAALLTGEETDPYRLAEFITFLLSSKDRHRFLTGCVIPYGA